MTRRWATLATALAILALAGCATPATPPRPPIPALPAAPALPPRPVELPITGIDPCGLLTAAQLRSFGIRKPGEFTPDTDQFGSPSCVWGTSSVPTHGSPLVRLIAKVPTETYLKNARPSQVVDIAGFPAVQTTGGDEPDHCLVLVDVAAGHTLWTQYDLFIGRQLPTEHICVDARRFAQAMVATLRAQQHR